jgi:hypothetical protein
MAALLKPSDFFCAHASRIRPRLTLHNRRYQTRACRRQIKMSPLCQLETTFPGRFPGVFGVTVRLMSFGELSRLEMLRRTD